MGSVLNIGWIEPTATDFESPPVTLLQTHRSGDSFTLGSTPVSYVFSDAAGNQATCMFTVTLEPGKEAYTIFYLIPRKAIPSLYIKHGI